MLAWGLGALFTIRWSPEIRFFKASYAVKSAWAAEIAQAHSNKTVFFGGSSCDFSIAPNRMLETHGMPAVNMGLGAGMGPVVLTRCAMQHTRPGDTLVIALEPGLLLESSESVATGVHFSYAAGHREWLVPFPGQAPYHQARALIELRPGGRPLFTLAAKLAGRKPLFRYQIEDTHRSGWGKTSVRVPLNTIPSPEPMSPDGRALLRAIADWGRTNHVAVLYSIPLGYTPPARETVQRRQHARWLAEVATLVPVLKDPKLGVDSDARNFADTEYHLAEEATLRRTDELAALLKTGAFWDPAELRRLGEER